MYVLTFLREVEGRGLPTKRDPHTLLYLSDLSGVSKFRSRLVSK